MRALIFKFTTAFSTRFLDGREVRARGRVRRALLPQSVPDALIANLYEHHIAGF